MSTGSTASTVKTHRPKLSRCKRGSRRNKKTGLCVPNNVDMRAHVKSPISNKRERARNAVYLRHAQKPFNWADYTDSNPWSDKSTPSKRPTPNKRCKKGTRKNKKTGLCEPHVR